MKKILGLIAALITMQSTAHAATEEAVMKRNPFTSVYRIVEKPVGSVRFADTEEPSLKRTGAASRFELEARAKLHSADAAWEKVGTFKVDFPRGITGHITWDLLSEAALEFMAKNSITKERFSQVTQPHAAKPSSKKDPFK